MSEQRAKEGRRNKRPYLVPVRCQAKAGNRPLTTSFRDGGAIGYLDKNNFDCGGCMTEVRV